MAPILENGRLQEKREIKHSDGIFHSLIGKKRIDFFRVDFSHKLTRSQMGTRMNE